MGAGWRADASLQRLFFRTLADAAKRLLQAKSVKPEEIVALGIRQRASLLSAAAYILDAQDSLSATIPSGVLMLAEQVLAVERPYAGELFALSVAGGAWDFSIPCLRCGGACKWSQVLAVPDVCPPEAAWRYERPENHVPICGECARVTGWENRTVRVWMAELLWGDRYDAFRRWHSAMKKGTLPDWNRLEYPLWPPEFSRGDAWELGSGKYGVSDPRPPTTLMVQVASNIVREAFPVGRGRRLRNTAAHLLSRAHRRVTDRLDA